MELLIANRNLEDILGEIMIEELSQQINRNILDRIENGA